MTSVSEKSFTRMQFTVIKSSMVPYRITDTGELVEKTKVIGRRWIKELGKKARCNLWEIPYQREIVGRSERLLSDCLSKTQVSAKPKGNV